MPIDREKYPDDWEAISLAVRSEADHKCEQCGAPNGEHIWRGLEDDAGTFYFLGWVYDDVTGKQQPEPRLEGEYCGREVKVVLTVAHIDHDESNMARENLKALCQMCHLRHDRHQHALSARATRNRKTGQSELFPETLDPKYEGNLR